MIKPRPDRAMLKFTTMRAVRVFACVCLWVDGLRHFRVARSPIRDIIQYFFPAVFSCILPMCVWLCVNTFVCGCVYIGVFFLFLFVCFL